MSVPIYEYLAGKEGDIWTPQDSDYVRGVFRQVEQLAAEVVLRAQEQSRLCTHPLCSCEYVSTRPAASPRTAGK
jgi:hypothetical protein